MNNELLKKNSFIDDMEPKYNASSESRPGVITERPVDSFLIWSLCCDSQLSEWKSWKKL